MEKYQAQRNNEEAVPEKTEKEKKQESTEKAVDLAGEVALDYFTGGQGSKIKDAAGNIPVVGDAVNKTWDSAVKGVSKVVSKTPAGDVLKKADDMGVTDTAKNAYGLYKSSGGNMGGNAPGNVGNGTTTPNANGLNQTNKSMSKESNTKNVAETDLEGGSAKKDQDKGILSGNIVSTISKAFKIKLLISVGMIFFWIMLLVTIVSGKDFVQLSATNRSEMARKSASSANVMAALEEVSYWYIDNVGVYNQGLYVQSPFSEAKVRADCTGFAVAYMSHVAGQDVPDSYSLDMIYPDGGWAKKVEELGWIAYTSDEVGELQPGDVLIADNRALYSTKGQHGEIYIDETHTFGWGSAKTTYPTNNTVSKSEFGGHVHFMDGGHDYITIFRYAGAVNIDNMNITEMYDDSFNHGSKPKQNQRYIMLHDTEMSENAEAVVNSWKNSGSGVAAHFVIDRDGKIIQAVDLDTIAHHAGFGGPGDFDSKFGVGNNDGTGTGDDLVGTQPLAGYTSYGMNSYSIGIEMCHVNGEDYPEAQLKALDKVIAYIDSYYGYKSEIIDHKEWRTSNSDTDAKFADYLKNYKTLRHY